MTRLEPDGGDSVGINPQLLQGMINTMNSATGDAQNLVNGYISQLSRVGLDTGSLAKAVQDLTWAQDQAPMLSRRQSLAEAMEQQDPSLGPMVSGGAGTLDFPTSRAAQAAGQSDGTKALQAVEERGNDDFILTELQQYADDPAYLAAFFTALGPQGLAALGLQVTGYQQGGQDSQYQDWAGTVGGAFATASYQMPYRQDWLGQLQLPDALDADPATPQLGLIQPFLDHGVYSSTWLNPLGQYALQMAYTQSSLAGGQPVQLDGIWTALSHNPAFDAQFYQQNFAAGQQNPRASISALMTNPAAIHQIDDSAFAGMVRAATVPPAGSGGTRPFAANAQMTVRYFGDDPGVTLSGPVRAAFGAITMSYFKYVADSVGAAAPGIGDGKNPASLPDWQITASSRQWAAFIQEAMGDKTTAAQLLTFYGAWNKSLGPYQTIEGSGGWSVMQRSWMAAFMAYNYQQSGKTAGGTPADIASVVAAGGAAFLTSLAFGPEAGVAETLLSAGADGGKAAFEDAATGVLQGPLSSALSSPGQSGSGDPTEGILGLQQQWLNVVTQQPGQPGDLPGDPLSYERQYGGNFLNSSGQLISPAALAQDSKALAALNAWLQDPAVVHKYYQAWIDEVQQEDAYLDLRFLGIPQ